MEMRSAALEIIPGLPNDIGMQCLLKVPRIYHACLASVCVVWRNAVRHPNFYRQRRRLGIVDPWLVIISTEICMAPTLLYSAYDLATKALLFTVKFPPSVEALKLNLPNNSAINERAISGLKYLDHYRIAAMNECFTVLGFSWHSRSRAPCCSLTIYNTVTDQWRLGAPLPAWRETFACGVIGDRLYVAGGVDANGETQSETLVYDFLTDTWSTAAPIPTAFRRVEADAVFQGKLYVLGDSRRAAKGRFCSYDPLLDSWQQVESKPPATSQHLLATDNFLYAIGSYNEIFRFDPTCSIWICAGRRMPVRMSSGGDKRRPNVALHDLHASQKAFGHGNDIFIINDSIHRGYGMSSDGITRWHRLVHGKPTLYHAGAVVSA